MEKNRALDCLSALGQETRLDAFRMLVHAGAEGMPASEVSIRLNVPANTLSTHLAVLQRAGLVSSRREGRVMRYFSDMDGMRNLLEFLLQDCCGGRPERCAALLTEVACERT